jgi:hypothetical protein
VKAITLTQPYATAIALGIKRVETRGWRTDYRGPLAIHASRAWTKVERDFAATERGLGRLPERIPLGAVVCTARLVDCIPTEEAALVISQDDVRRWGIEHIYGDYSPGRWAWLLDGVEPLPEPIFVRGSLGLWEWRR